MKESFRLLDACLPIVVECTRALGIWRRGGREGGFRLTNTCLARVFPSSTAAEKASRARMPRYPFWLDGYSLFERLYTLYTCIGTFESCTRAKVL